MTAVLTVVFTVAHLAMIGQQPSHPVVTRVTGPADYPVVTERLRPSFEQRTVFEVGDTLVQVGSIDMRGAAFYSVLRTFSAEGTRRSRVLPVRVIRRGRVLDLLEPLEPTMSSSSVTLLLRALIGLCVALVIALRARPSAASRGLFYGLVPLAIISLSVAEVPPPLFDVMMLVGAVTAPLVGPLLLRALMAFPAEANGYEGWWRLLPWLFLPMGVTLFSAVYGFPLDKHVGESSSQLIVPISGLAIMGALTRNYVRSGARGRRQIKWIVYAVYVGAIAQVVQSVAIAPGKTELPNWHIAITVLSTTLFHVAILVAATRFDLFDIDRLIGATLVYNAVGAVALSIGFLLVPRIAQAMSRQLEINATVSQTALTVSLAIVVLLLARLIRPGLERRLFRERYALEQAMRDLPEQFIAIREPLPLFEFAGAALTRLLRPSMCAVYVAGDDAFVPVFVAEGTLAPLIPRTSHLARELADMSGAQLLAVQGRRPVDQAERALFDQLEARVAGPIRRHEELEAFVLLGEKRSGDIYTSSDLALLTVLLKTLSTHMLRFDEAELLKRAQELQSRMQRYVPGALAELLTAGEELETGEREVSVLFVDLRGYTAFADGKATRDIFSTVNRYTETVSRVVRAEGGVVVEFNGDGMMAVFGAPRPLAAKEVAAVVCGQRLAREIPLMESPQHPMSVGIGIATGLAFVGNIEAVDRTIWSAIGSTTNRAARLQALTRAHGSAMLIDDATWRAAAAHTETFQALGELEIRGVRHPVSVFAWSPSDSADSMASSTAPPSGLPRPS